MTNEPQNKTIEERVKEFAAYLEKKVDYLERPSLRYGETIGRTQDLEKFLHGYSLALEELYKAFPEYKPKEAKK